MRCSPNSCKMRLQLLLGLCCCLCLGGDASNPLEQLALGALSVSEQLMNTMQDGNKATQQFGIDSPLLKWRSKTELGHGDAMRQLGDDSDESESDERRRRRKRSPCFNKMTMATTESDDDVEARRKAAAARKRAANNASRSRIIRRTKTKKKLQLQLRRQRRQVEAEQRPPSLGERFKGLWLSLVDNVVDAMQQMRQQLKGAATAAAGS